MSSSVSTNVLKVKVQSRVVDLDSEKKNVLAWFLFLYIQAYRRYSASILLRFVFVHEYSIGS